MPRGRREPGTGEVTVEMTGKESSPLSSTALKNACDCTKSLRMIRAFFSSWESSLKSSGILEEDKEKGRRKRRKKTGGGPARERRRLKRAEARMTTTSSTRSPSPFDTSALVSDDVRLYMGEGVVLPDNQGQVKVDLVKSVAQVAKFQQVSHSGHRLGNNNYLKIGGNFTPVGQLRLGEVDRHDCNRVSPRSQSSLSNYGKASSLELGSPESGQWLRPGESEHAEVDLTNKTWFFDSIPKQNARELLREFGK